MKTFESNAQRFDTVCFSADTCPPPPPPPHYAFCRSRYCTGCSCCHASIAPKLLKALIQVERCVQASAVSCTSQNYSYATARSPRFRGLSSASDQKYEVHILVHAHADWISDGLAGFRRCRSILKTVPRSMHGILLQMADPSYGVIPSSLMLVVGDNLDPVSNLLLQPTTCRIQSWASLHNLKTQNRQAHTD